MQLYCLNPVRILVGNWFDILSSTAHCLFNSKYYPLSKFHPDFVNYFTSGRLDKSKAKRFYSGDWQPFDSDGCPLTLFQDVPCGKCTCCVDKKQWTGLSVLFVSPNPLILFLCFIHLLIIMEIYRLLVFLRNNGSFV